MVWRAHPQCPGHIRLTLERAVNTFPPEWLEPHTDDEMFDSVDACLKRLVAYSLSQGFDVVISNSSRRPPRATFCCTHHGEETRNTRKLESTVERDEGVTSSANEMLNPNASYWSVLENH
jgi:hypothetical protein